MRGPLLVDGHYAWTSPLELTDPGVTVLAVHGRADEAVSAEWSRRLQCLALARPTIS